MSLLKTDLYSQKVESLNTKILNESIEIFCREIVSDIISNVRISQPPQPDLTDRLTFKFFFTRLNKRYLSEYSDYTKDRIFALLSEISNSENLMQEVSHWDGSFDKIENLIEKVTNKQLRKDLKNKLNLIKYGSKTKDLYSFSRAEEVKEMLLNFADSVVEANIEVSNELGLYPNIFDYFTRASLADVVSS